MMSEGFCGLHGRYMTSTAAGCPQCQAARFEQEKPGAPIWSWIAPPAVPADFVSSLLRERDRYRDALRLILGELESAPTEEEAIDGVGRLARQALATQPGSEAK